jgi:F-type H+-transporting ATPase subunit b
LSAIEQTAKNKIREAVIEGSRITEEIRKKANQEADEMVNNAKESIKYELSKAKEELKETIVDLTIQSTENLIKEKMTEQNDRRLVKDFLDKVDKI